MKPGLPTMSNALRRERGMTLVELMISLVISSLIVIASAAFLLGSSRTSATQDAAGQLQDNARYITELMTRNIQQAGFQNYVYGSAGAEKRREIAPPVDGEPDIRGWENSAAGTSTDHGSHDRSTNRVNNSDTLVLRFQGMSSTVTTVTGTTSVTNYVVDGSMIDCRGQPVAQTDGSTDRAYSIFEIRRASSTAEPELRCKYLGTSGTFVSEVIARGVETLQVMFGLDTDGNSVADSWKTAKQTDLANAWSKVTSVRVGLVIRSPSPVAVGAAGGSFKPLGDPFTGSSTDDPGGTLTVSDDGRLRRVVTFTVNVRNVL